MAYKSYRPEDFEAIVTKHENRLYRTALAITGNMSDAEDIVQEAFLRAYERAPDFETEEHEKAWLIRVTVNLCNSRLRSPWRKRTEPLLDSYPAMDLKQHELLERILALPPKYRTVIHLFYYEGYSIRTFRSDRTKSYYQKPSDSCPAKLKSVLRRTIMKAYNDTWIKYRFLTHCTEARVLCC